MVTVRNILHPVDSARSVYRRVGRFIIRRYAQRRFSKIPRNERHRCWCGGELLPFRWHSSYGVCVDCGCYVNRRPPTAEALRDTYTLDRYWRLRQRMRGHPPIETRANLYKSDGRLDYWLRLIEDYGPREGRVIEIGCAPGIVLAELRRRGYECVGVEPDRKVADWIRRNMDVDVREGVFPGIPLPTCGLFLAFDVAEHVSDPKEFWQEMARLLGVEGVAIIQTPIERRDYEHPFKTRPDWFDDIEHTFLFTEKAINRLAAFANLEIVRLEDSIGSLGQVCVIKRPRASGSFRNVGGYSS